MSVSLDLVNVENANVSLYLGIIITYPRISA